MSAFIITEWLGIIFIERAKPWTAVRLFFADIGGVCVGVGGEGRHPRLAKPEAVGGRRGCPRRRGGHLFKREGLLVNEGLRLGLGSWITGEVGSAPQKGGSADIAIYIGDKPQEQSQRRAN